MPQNNDDAHLPEDFEKKSPEDQIHALKTLLATLESRVDMLESELAYLNHLLLKFGFPEGIDSLKLAIEELLDDEDFPPS